MSHTKGKIILTNFNGVLAEVIYDLLGRWGYNSFRIQSPESLLPFLQDVEPVLVFFQFRDFSDSEYKLFHSIKNVAPNIPLLATSSFISIKDAFKIGKVGAIDYIQQPIHPLNLKRTIEEYL